MEEFIIYLISWRLKVLVHLVFVMIFIPLCIIYELLKYLKTKRIHTVEY